MPDGRRGAARLRSSLHDDPVRGRPGLPGDRVRARDVQADVHVEVHGGGGRRGEPLDEAGDLRQRRGRLPDVVEHVEGAVHRLQGADEPGGAADEDGGGRRGLDAHHDGADRQGRGDDGDDPHRPPGREHDQQEERTRLDRDEDQPDRGRRWWMTACYAPQLLWAPLLAVLTWTYFRRRTRAS